MSVGLINSDIILDTLKITAIISTYMLLNL